MRTAVAEGWSHLHELLFEGSWNPTLRRYRSPWTFRGLSDAGVPVTTSLARLGQDPSRLEHHLLRNFTKYARRDIVEFDSVWHWLSLAQHHGLPTRLLDWSYSPLVAMHFATCDLDRYDRDGAILAVNYEEAHKLLPDRLRGELESEGANSFTSELLARMVSTLDEFDRLSPEPLLLFFEPPSIDERIVNQYALFSILSDASAGLDAWFTRHPELCRRIVLPAAIKWELRDKLDQCNVTERVLFPGLDGLSIWLRRHYRLREPPSFGGGQSCPPRADPAESA